MRTKTDSSRQRGKRGEALLELRFAALKAGISIPQACARLGLNYADVYQAFYRDTRTGVGKKCRRRVLAFLFRRIRENHSPHRAKEAL